MSSLLEKDYNTINYQDFYNNRMVIELPQGKLGKKHEKKKTIQLSISIKIANLKT